MSKLDFNDDSEKVLVEQVFGNAMESLADEDRQLPQVRTRKSDKIRDEFKGNTQLDVIGKTRIAEWRSNVRQINDPNPSAHKVFLARSCIIVLVQVYSPSYVVRPQYSTQVEAILPLLKRGVGIHHGGLLPILKEVIEILFQVGRR